MPGGFTHPTGWLSYDSVAETYERVAVPWFDAMVHDLVRSVVTPTVGRVLDVGTGTGLAAKAVSVAAGPAVVVIGLDPSTGMLRLARSRRNVTGVAGMVPGLPFPSASFDVALANLVVSHLPDLGAGLVDMRRVLTPRGRLAFTAWGPEVPATDDEAREADTIVASVRDGCGLASTAPVSGAPWEQQLRGRRFIIDALDRAGLRHPDAQLHTYRHRFTADEYVSGWGGLGRYLRSTAGDQRWQDFADRAAGQLRRRFGDTISSVKQSWVVTSSAS